MDKDILFPDDGVDSPSPGILTFHLRLEVSLQVVGGLAVGETPLARGRAIGASWCSGAVAARSGKVVEEAKGDE